jgi:hypothetical protein
MGQARNTDTFLERKVANIAKKSIDGGFRAPGMQAIQSQK